MASIRTISFDGVIVGGGGSGMRAALQLAQNLPAKLHYRFRISIQVSLFSHYFYSDYVFAICARNARNNQTASSRAARISIR